MVQLAQKRHAYPKGATLACGGLPTREHKSVGEIPVNDGKHQNPRQIVEAKPHSRITAKSQNPPLDEQIKEAKLRAQRLGLAHDASEWAKLLEAAGVTVINSAHDLAKVNGHMTAFEKGVIVTK